MLILNDFERFGEVGETCVIAAGFFDGVHRGHQRVLAAAHSHARAVGGLVWGLTFDRHPLDILDPERRPPLLTSLKQRIEILAGQGLDGCLVLPFTREMAEIEPMAFLKRMAGSPHRVESVFCGPNWRYGRHAQGTPEMLAKKGGNLGFATHTVPALLYRGQPVSSTRIRNAVSAGHLAEAADMLGRHYAIRESVVRGRGMGRRIGSATANLHPMAEVLPPEGVYAVRVRHGERLFEGVANLGRRPTFSDVTSPDTVLELHLFDFDAELYGHFLDISFIAYLREECVFPNTDALAAQIQSDILRTRELFACMNRS